MARPRNKAIRDPFSLRNGPEMHRYLHGGGIVADFFRFLTNAHTWRRHPAPFSKLRKGYLRRQERRFAVLLDRRELSNV